MKGVRCGDMERRVWARAREEGVHRSDTATSCLTPPPPASYRHLLPHTSPPPASYYSYLLLHVSSAIAIRVSRRQAAPTQ